MILNARCRTTVSFAIKGEKTTTMKTAGIIAEYNPFHNGHAYQLNTVREQTGADYIIVAMSGNFLQRGVPAIVDKHMRADMALAAGADLILELPVFYATASAEFFAWGGVDLLGATGVVDNICYGMETPHPDLMQDIVNALSNPSSGYDSRICGLTREGMTFPLARQTALVEMFPARQRREISTFLSTPNNILALEYEKAIQSRNVAGARPIQGITLQRVGDGYHDTHINSRYASATAIRRLLLSDTSQTDSAILSELLPKSSLDLLSEAASMQLFTDTNDFSEALYTRLLADRETGYDHYADCSHELSNRIVNQLDNFVSFTQFAELLKTKELTHTRINRVLTHILLGITWEDYCCTPAPYLRVLGFTRRAEPLLTEISKKASAPLITKVADASNILSDSAQCRLQKEIRCTHLYNGIRRIKSGVPLRNEYTQPLIIRA